jgi:exonuclease SbcD
MISENGGALPKKIRVLHTADWHIGRMLHGKKRYDEFDAFFAWLGDTISREEIDVLIVAGDVFDNTTPNNRSQQIYYRFLCRVAASSCRHVVVVAGNHDSPSFLDAPRELLKALDVHVVGNVATPYEDEVLALRDVTGEEELIVCAVPYLRDRDIRIAEAGESVDDKERKLIEGIRSHYREVCEMARLRRDNIGRPVPILAIGHLFTVGGVTGDGVRDLYVGTLASVGASEFPDVIDYLALGHLHVAQKVNGSDFMRYSGSPLPMGFGEAGQDKSVCVIEFTGSAPTVTTVSIPTFQKLERIKGSLVEIFLRIAELSKESSEAWLEISYEGDEIIGDLRGAIEDKVSVTGMEVLRIKDSRAVDKVLSSINEDECLDELDHADVFARCLDAYGVAIDQRPELMICYREVFASTVNKDANAE